MKSGDSVAILHNLRVCYFESHSLSSQYIRYSIVSMLHSYRVYLILIALIVYCASFQSILYKYLFLF